MTGPAAAWREPARHDLLRLTRDGWASLAGREPALATTAWLPLWAARDFPVMRRRAQPGDDPFLLPVAVALPAAFGRARPAFQVARADVAVVQRPPALVDVLPRLPDRLRARAIAALSAAGTDGPTTHLFGSAMWQAVTGLDCLHERSDLDLLWCFADTPDRPDRIDRLLAALSALDASAGVQLDGEIVLDDHRAVNWRELAAPGGNALLVKTVDAVGMMSRPAFLAREPVPC